MTEIKQTTNIKTDVWYNNCYDWVIEHNDYDYFNDFKKEDRLIDLFHVIHNHLSPFIEQMDEAWSIMNTFYKKYHSLPLQERKNKLKNSKGFKEAKERHDKAMDNYCSDIPSGVSKEEFDCYHQLIRGKRGDNSDKEIILNYNTLEKNAKYLEILIAHYNNIKNKEAYKQICRPDCKEYNKTLEKSFKLCKQALKDGYLITSQLVFFYFTINECGYCFESIKKKWRHSQTLSDDIFRGFSYTDDQIYDLIRKNANWHDIERDIAIFQERQKSKSLQELADNFGIKFNSISMVLKKVRSAFNYYEGKLFEDFIEKRLKQSGLFKKVVKEAGKGEPDILAYFKDGKRLNIYSLKNIRIDRKPYWLVVDELRPELARAKLQTKDYKVNLVLLVFNNHTNHIKRYNIDYRNPVNIDISK